MAILLKIRLWFEPSKQSYSRNQPPKVEKKILPSLTIDQITYLLEQAESIRDKAIISLLTDSGLRLSELARIKKQDIDCENRLIRSTVKVIKKG